MNIRRLLPKFIRKWRFDKAVEELKIALFNSPDVKVDLDMNIDPTLFEQCVNIYKEYWHIEA